MNQFEYFIHHDACTTDPHTMVNSQDGPYFVHYEPTTSRQIQYCLRFYFESFEVTLSKTVKLPRK